MTSAFVASISDMKNDEILSGLKLIGKIQPDQKLFLNPNISLGSDSYLSALIRTFTHDNNRACTFNFLSAIIEKAFVILQELHSAKDDVYKADQCSNLITDLISCREGIHKLSLTYSYDVKMCCDLELLIQKINSKLLVFGVDTKEPSLAVRTKAGKQKEPKVKRVEEEKKIEKVKEEKKVEEKKVEKKVEEEKVEKKVEVEEKKVEEKVEKKVEEEKKVELEVEEEKVEKPEAEKNVESEAAMKAKQAAEERARRILEIQQKRAKK